MQDYHIYVHADKNTRHSPTSPQRNAPNKTAVETEEAKEMRESKHKHSQIISTGLVLQSASKINGYVGELTENRVQARKVSLGITSAGLVAGAFTNPALAFTAAAMYFADKAINYGIRVYKENLSADYMRQLSGGTVKTGR